MTDKDLIDFLVGIALVIAGILLLINTFSVGGLILGVGLGILVRKVSSE